MSAPLMVLLGSLLVVLAQAADGGAPAPSPPPLVLGEPVVLPAPPPPAAPARADKATTALLFSPLSLVAAFLSFEFERALTKTLTGFALLGAGLFRQVGGDLGLRLYLSDAALRGPYVGAHASVFYLALSQTLLVGPGVTFGYDFRPRDTFVISVGAGLHVWHQPIADTPTRILGMDPRLNVVLLPGMHRPGVGGWAPQPMLRVSVGPTF